MRILIAEDDLISRKFLSRFLSKYGDCDLVVDGMEALDAYMMAIKEKNAYDLICLDIMMPNVDGVKVLKIIRQLEEQNNISSDERCKVIMTTALADTQFVQKSFEIGCDAYAAKPIDTERLVEVMKKLGLIKDSIE
ncbi:MAG: response regulator [Marinisporobacter sp.]|jgi:two-component system chemotaxis response regulator CheY|nr:response regulator [Marinisporobacter sp.]